MSFMLGKRQTNIGFDNDDDDGDGLWGYSTVSVDSHVSKECVAQTNKDRTGSEVGYSWSYHNFARTLACPGSHARSAEDPARSASVGIPQGNDSTGFSMAAC